MRLSPDQIAELVERGYDELNERFQTLWVEPFSDTSVERALLDRFLELAGPGLVCDAGCGTGRVARFLHEAGRDVMGIDVSEAALDLARRINPEVDFRRLDLLDLALESGALAGMTSFYTLIHFPGDRLERALSEIHRVMRAGSPLLVACYRGRGERLVGPAEGYAVDMYVRFVGRRELSQALEATGFVALQVAERTAEPGEISADRLLVLAQKTSGES